MTATNTGTGITSKTTTGPNGSYTIPLLPVGTYQVSAEQPGFKRFVSNGIIVRSRAKQPALISACNWANVSETVQVQAEEPLLRPDTSDLGTVITGSKFWICRC